MKSIQIMKKVDEVLFENLEKLKVYDQFQDFLETYSNWEEKSQEIFKAIMLSIIILIPTLVLFIFFLINSSNQQQLETKEEILKVATKIKNQKSMVTTLSRKYLGSPINSKTMLETQLKSGLPGMNIDQSKIKIGSFETQEDDGLKKISADVNFNQLSSQNLFGFLRLITISKKMRIEEINIEKNKQTNLLKGVITIFHYSKLSDNLDE